MKKEKSITKKILTTKNNISKYDYQSKDGNKYKTKFNVIKLLCRRSKNLYNVGLYSVRQNFFNKKEYLKYTDNYHLLHYHKNYQMLPNDISQHVLKLVEQDFKSFFGLLKKKQSNNYDSKIKIPKYKEKKGFDTLTIPKNHIRPLGIDKIYLSLPKNLKRYLDNKFLEFKLPKGITYDNLKMIKIKPIVIDNKMISYTINWNYQIDIKNTMKSNDNLLSIDLGIDNIVSMVNSFNGESILFNGLELKSLNRYFNKKISKFQSELKQSQDKNRSIKINNLYEKRNNLINEYLHSISNKIVDYCLNNNISKIIIGNNKEWKQNINIGKKNNQNFVSIPHSKLINYIEYKSELYGIKTILQEESFTSKCDSLVLEPLPKYKKSNKDTIEKNINPLSKKKYLGKRIKRGLFLSSNGKVFNSDINGAINIMRKYLQTNKKCKLESKIISRIEASGLIYNPLKVTINNRRSSIFI